MIMETGRRCWAEINLDAISHNFQLVRQIAGSSEPIAVIKANAYGHGDIMVAKALRKAGAKWFGVACFQEAERLRNAGFQSNILILGDTPPEYAQKLAALRITQCVFSPDYALRLSRAAQLAGVEVEIHIKADTGMGRLGFNAKDNLGKASHEIQFACNLPGLVPKGLFTHFAVADSFAQQDITYTEQQFSLFSRLQQKLLEEGQRFEMAHCCNSAGVAAYPEMKLDAVRPGIVLYGFNPSRECGIGGLRPAFSMKTIITQVKTVQKGDRISYGGVFVAKKEMRIATASAGYADGYPRLLSSKGKVQVCGQSANVVGRVCMDQIMVDVSEIPQVKPGCVLTLFGGEYSDTVDEVAALCGTINYEILCNIGNRVPRVYVHNGKETGIVNYMEG